MNPEQPASMYKLIANEYGNSRPKDYNEWINKQDKK
jgi:hypothetical protein